MRLEYFEMIDRVAALDAAGGTIAAQALVPQASPVFEGHFPGHPLMPGVLLVETMAQASGYLLLARNGFERMPFLAGIKQGKLRSFVTPGVTLDIAARLVHDGSGFAVTAAEIAIAGKRICDSELTFRLAPFPAGDFADALRSRAEAIGLAPAPA